MFHSKNGFMSGFIATFIVVSMMAMNDALHSIPEVHIANTLARVLGHADKPLIGWVVVMVLGIFVFGGLFAAYAHRLPVSTYLGKGLALGMASWLFMMLVFMPVAGAGLFGLDRSFVVPLVTLILNLVYWVALAFSYRWLGGSNSLQNQARV